MVDRDGVMQLVDQFIDDPVRVDQVQRTIDQILVFDGLRLQKMLRSWNGT